MSPSTLIVTAACAAVVATSAAAQTGSAASRRTQTDETIAVTRGARLAVDSFAGDVVVRGWNKDAVRVQARHATGTRVAIRTTATGVTVSASGPRGPAGSVDFEINVPVWMAVKVDGHYSYIAVEGTAADVAAQNVRGEISIKGGSGFVSARSVEGELLLDGPRGRITARSVSQGITIARASGDVVAETTNGPIRMTAMQVETVTASTVNGNISFEGAPSARGRYRCTTHNGSIVVAVPESANASFGIRTYNGAFHTNLSLQGGADVRRGQRVTFRLGSGAAEFELESFGGTIHLRRPAAAAASPQRSD